MMIHLLAIHHTDTMMKEMLKRREKRERDKVIKRLRAKEKPPKDSTGKRRFSSTAFIR